MKAALAAILAGCSLALASAACAQAYLGASIGLSEIDDSVTDNFIDPGGRVDGEDTGFKLFGGYMFTPSFGLEAAYVDLGRASYSGSFFGAPVTDGSVEIWGFNLASLAAFPLNEKLTLFGKAGLFLWESEVSDVTSGARFSDANKGWDASYGLGASYQLTPNVAALAEWEWFNFEPSDATLLSIGLAYRF